MFDVSSLACILFCTDGLVLFVLLVILVVTVMAVVVVVMVMAATACTCILAIPLGKPPLGTLDLLLQRLQLCVHLKSLVFIPLARCCCCTFPFHSTWGTWGT